MKTQEESTPGLAANRLNIGISYSNTNDTNTNDPRNAASSLPSLPVSNPTRSYWHMTHPNDLINHRTTPDLPTKARVVIIGSGFSSVFAVKELTKRGIKDVVVLEAREICSGATGRNGGHCQPLCYDQIPEVGRFELKNITTLSNLIKEKGIKCDWSPFPDGGCHAYFSHELFDSMKSKISAMKQEAPDLANLIRIVEDPNTLAKLKIPTAIGAILQANASALHPYKLVTHLWRELLSTTNLNLQTTTPVTRIEPSTTIISSPPTSSSVSWLVNTARGTITTPQILCATNAYTAALLPVFHKLIVPVQGQMSALKPPPNMQQYPLQHDYGFRAIMEQDAEEDDYLVQRPVVPKHNTTDSSVNDDTVAEGGGGRYKGGGELMFGGGRVVAHNAAIGVSDDSYVDERTRRYLRRMLPRLMDLYGNDSDGDERNKRGEMQKLPERYVTIEQEDDGEAGDLTPLAEWSGIMGYSRDGFPWVGAVPDMDGVWVCAGYTGHGMPNAGLCGTHIAELIATSSSSAADEKQGGKEEKERDRILLLEAEAVKEGRIPACYVISEERIRKAKELPEISSNVAEVA